MSAEEVAKAFVEHFYKTFDESGVDALAGLFVSFYQLDFLEVGRVALLGGWFISTDYAHFFAMVLRREGRRIFQGISVGRKTL